MESKGWATMTCAGICLHRVVHVKMNTCNTDNDITCSCRKALPQFEKQRAATAGTLVDCVAPISGDFAVSQLSGGRDQYEGMYPLPGGYSILVCD